MANASEEMFNCADVRRITAQAVICLMVISALNMFRNHAREQNYVGDHR